jgi:sulfur carrier protein
MQLVINGQPREFAQLASDSRLENLIQELGLKGDRVAVEHNGSIVPRTEWERTPLADGDKLEIVHFVGGGCLTRDQESGIRNNTSIIPSEAEGSAFS